MMTRIVRAAAKPGNGRNRVGGARELGHNFRR